MFCRSCEYELQNLARHRCSECGRPFDPINPATFLNTPTGMSDFQKVMDRVWFYLAWIVGGIVFLFFLRFWFP